MRVSVSFISNFFPMPILILVYLFTCLTVLPSRFLCLFLIARAPSFSTYLSPLLSPSYCPCSWSFRGFWSGSMSSDGLVCSDDAGKSSYLVVGSSSIAFSGTYYPTAPSALYPLRPLLGPFCLPPPLFLFACSAAPVRGGWEPGCVGFSCAGCSSWWCSWERHNLLLVNPFLPVPLLS